MLVNSHVLITLNAGVTAHVQQNLYANQDSDLMANVNKDKCDVLGSHDKYQAVVTEEISAIDKRLGSA